MAETSIPFHPKIRSVTIYPDRALVFRSSEMDFAKGRHRLVFREASPELESSSLRGFATDSSVIVQGIHSWIERKSHTLDPGIRKLEDELAVLERKRDAWRLAKERQKSELSGIRDYEKYLKESIAYNSRTDLQAKANWQRALLFLAERKKKALSQSDALEVSIQENNKRIYLLKKRLSQLQAAGRKYIRIIELHLQATKAVRSRVGFAYIMKRASWQVSYGMHYKKGRVEVEYFGNVRQITGEDWKNVAVRLSTSRPATGAARSYLTALSVGARVARTRTEYVQQEEKAAEEPPEASSEGRPESGTGGYADLDAGGNSVVFRIPGRARIPSSKRRFRLSIARFTLKPRKVYDRVVGARLEAAYTTARLVNNRPFPMLAGAVDIYRSSGFMGRSHIRHTASGGSFLLNLGSNRNIRVERSVRRYRKAAGVLSSRKVLVRTIRIRLHNRGSEASRIGLFERIPVSETEEIKVRILPKTSPGYKETAKDSGILRWDLPLPAGAKRTIELSYEVEAPPEFPERLLGK